MPKRALTRVLQVGCQLLHVFCQTRCLTAKRPCCSRIDPFLPEPPLSKTPTFSNFQDGQPRTAKADHFGDLSGAVRGGGGASISLGIRGQRPSLSSSTEEDYWGMLRLGISSTPSLHWREVPLPRLHHHSVSAERVAATTGRGDDPPRWRRTLLHHVVVAPFISICPQGCQLPAAYNYHGAPARAAADRWPRCPMS
jgi:hypothetical protein